MHLVRWHCSCAFLITEDYNYTKIDIGYSWIKIRKKIQGNSFSKTFRQFMSIWLDIIWLNMTFHFFSKAPSVFSHVFILASNTHEQNNRFASYGLLINPTCNTSKYDTNAFVASAIASWIFFQKEFPSNNMRQISYSPLKCWLRITCSIPTTKFL